eukprot:4753258-Pleurochrysis_carterae.AAC.2
MLALPVFSLPLSPARELALLDHLPPFAPLFLPPSPNSGAEGGGGRAPGASADRRERTVVGTDASALVTRHTCT